MSPSSRPIPIKKLSYYFYNISICISTRKSIFIQESRIAIAPKALNLAVYRGMELTKDLLARILINQ